MAISLIAVANTVPVTDRMSVAIQLVAREEGRTVKIAVEIEEGSAVKITVEIMPNAAAIVKFASRCPAGAAHRQRFDVEPQPLCRRRNEDICK